MLIVLPMETSKECGKSTQTEEWSGQLASSAEGTTSVGSTRVTLGNTDSPLCYVQYAQETTTPLAFRPPNHLALRLLSHCKQTTLSEMVAHSFFSFREKGERFVAPWMLESSSSSEEEGDVVLGLPLFFNMQAMTTGIL
eukprot:TRINITY_DN6567_c0_g2_i10.p1 TRINITY_DN6567_c0_g2~~TRINITY_DN6567_c0_g2_i10.p1  ORF type:complete len:139 (+),score=7.01 TRINITY_DN6567_c0_g2_i10:154-570(+)